MGARLDVDRLSFRYGPQDPWVLKECSFTAEGGESLAIVGASGCGKRTLTRLLLGSLTPTRGSITLDGWGVERFGHRHYRQMVSAVMHEDQLIKGSLAENIVLGSGHHHPNRVEEAAVLASVHDEIAAMPMGYHTLAHRMDSALSDTLKHRVLLARALYSRPRVMVLETDAMQLDVKVEQILNDAVRCLRLTLITISYSAQAIASADRVLVLRQGRVEQEVRPRTACGGVAEARSSR